MLQSFVEVPVNRIESSFFWGVDFFCMQVYCCYVCYGLVYLKKLNLNGGMEYCANTLRPWDGLLL